MGTGSIRVQDAVKAACSLSYVAEKLGISRPTLYRYMELYDAGDGMRIPSGVRDLFDFVTSARRSEEDVIMHFMRRPQPRGGEPRVRIATGGGRVMVMFPDADPDDVVVRIYSDFDGIREVIGEYVPEPGRRYVTVDDLIPGTDFYLEVVSGGVSTGLTRFDVQGRSPGGKGLLQVGEKVVAARAPNVTASAHLRDGAERGWDASPDADGTALRPFRRRSAP